ncbi:type II toxin-antitoxin system HicB family antitoxin [Candidatus Palauibacter sp.]|uniref:type II toxin-antitoxin system HicB family antitoxin n=1 Tax=Candidatus Palauibacter sp. TaxID=3101350 RepID=UPI003B011D13
MNSEAKCVRYYMNLPWEERVTEEFLDDGSSYYVARIVELVGCTSHGGSVDEALSNLRDAMQLYLGTMMKMALRRPHRSWGEREGRPTFLRERDDARRRSRGNVHDPESGARSALELTWKNS